MLPFGPKPGPLPPLLARLHALLDAHVEDTEEGVLIIEQDRRVLPGDAPRLPVLVFVPAKPSAPGPTGRVAPELIIEVLGPGQDDERPAKYARAGVKELWRVADGPVVTVLNDPVPAEGRWARSRVFRGPERVVSEQLPRLALTPAQLA